MRRGLNLAGALDGPGALRPPAEWFDVVQAAGFDFVRLPVRWDVATFDEVSAAVDLAHSHGLEVVLNAHHWVGGDLGAVWAAIAPRFDRVAFELLNEPHEPMTAAEWNALLRVALAAVRAVDATRPVIVGPARWNTIGALEELSLPDDEHLIVTVHYYSPFRFTHQGAGWLDGASEWLGTRWGTAEERERVRRDLEFAARWAAPRPLLLGEFGTLETAPMDDRAAWTALVRGEAERLGIAWCYWDFCTDFGAYDRSAGAWREPLRAALMRS